MVRDTLIGQDTDTGEDVWIPYNSRSVGVTIIGKSGTGKSSLLERLILSDLECGTPGMVIDPHGQLAERIVRLTPPEHAHRLMLLEAIRSEPFGLNLLAVRDPIDEDDDPVTWAADSVIATVKKLYGEDDEFLPRLERYLDLAVRTLIPGGGTLLDAPRLFEDTGFRDRCLSRVDRHEQATLRGGWASYDRLRPGERITHTEALVNRLERLLTPPIIRGILGSPRTTVPFEEVLAGETMLIISLPSDRLSPERCDFLGALLLCALADRVFARSVTAAPSRLHIYLDEYQRFATSTTAELLTQGRKYGAGVTLAHQDLHQIRDLRIRNASRHAGTLIVLGVTRPDAEQLAGEFPVRPKPEWTETIKEVDGTQPVYVFSSTPAEDIFLERHPDDEVDLAARSFFKYTPRRSVRMPKADYRDVDVPDYRGRVRTKREKYWYDGFEVDPSDNRKSVMVHPRPGGVHVHPDAQVEASALNGLLVDAMDGRVASPEDFTAKLIEHHLFLDFSNQSSSIKGMESWDPARQPFEKVFEQERDSFLRGIRAWLLVHAKDRTALRAGEPTDVFRKADEKLATFAVARAWRHLCMWQGGVTKKQDGTYAPAYSSERWEFGSTPLSELFPNLPLESRKPPPGSHPKLGKEYRHAIESIDILRERVRWSWILCEGLRRTPVRITSGAHEPRLVTRHIVHPAQTQQDALNEFAATLVNPPERFVAHVRLPGGYHQVKLVPPVDGTENPSVGPVPPVDGPDNLAQLQQVRERSQQRYRRPEDTREGPTPGERPDSQSPPTISRRPGGWQEPPDDDSPVDDEDTA